MKKLAILSACLVMATGGGVSAKTMDNCIDAAAAAAEAAGTNVTTEQVEEFCSCFHPIASESDEIKAEMKANEGFPPPGEESDELLAVINECRS